MTPQDWRDLPLYNESNTCPACGKVGDKCRYLSLELTHPSTKQVIEVGYLRRECERCGFLWNEKPLHLENLGN